MVPFIKLAFLVWKKLFTKKKINYAKPGTSCNLRAAKAI